MNTTLDPALWNLPVGAVSAQWFTHSRLPLCITDPNRPNNPIVFVNRAFTELTGYSADESIGRNCRFLQGPDTDPDSVRRLRDVLAGRVVDTVEIVNYRKDGTKFLNALQIGPIFDDAGKLIHFFGSQMDVTARREAEQAARALADAELLHRLRNIVNVMTAIIRMTAREESDTDAFGRKVAERMSTLSEAHFRTLGADGERTLSLAGIARFVLDAYAPRGTAQFSLSGPSFDLPRDLLSPISLMLHELATNSVKHGALGTEAGNVGMTWETAGDGAMLHLTWAESDGPPVATPSRHSGSRIIGSLVAATGGEMDFDWRPEGLRVEARFPLRR